ncbi:unnamed protein product [Rotaria magnacalcarata]|uniref:Uncharacterized protein n=1 Tax=Rotaria magnacalcarata TaxID=392030 RepID=A0A816U9E5_9BILA|nr:unnamed protein product [Rotaria magnacalcarata]CAF4251623.1 unnamed protein product [Rotaria magnacalcarata]
MATNNCSCEMYMYICKQHTNPNSLLTNKLKLLNSLARAVSEGRSASEVKLFAELKSLIPVDTESVSKIQANDKNCATNQLPPHVTNVQIDKRSKQTAPTVPVQQNVTTVTTKQIAPTVPVQQNVTTVTTKPIAPIVTSQPNVLIDSAPPNVPTVASQPNVQTLVSKPNVPTVFSLLNVSAITPLQNKNIMKKTLIKARNNSNSIKTQNKENFEIYNKYTPKFVKDAAVKIYVGNCLRRESVFFSLKVHQTSKENCCLTNDILNVNSTKDNMSRVQYDATSQCTEKIKIHDCQNNNQFFHPQNKKTQISQELDLWLGKSGSVEFERNRINLIVKICNTWIENNKDEFIPYFLRGDAMMNLDRTSEAIADYERVMEITVDEYAVIRHRIAILYNRFPTHVQERFLSNFNTTTWNWAVIEEYRAFSLVWDIVIEEDISSEYTTQKEEASWKKPTRSEREMEERGYVEWETPSLW